MKLCTKCNKKFDSDSNFCDECGSQLIDFEIKYCPKCGAQCTSLDAFCKKCSNPLSVKQPPVQNQTTGSGSSTVKYSVKKANPDITEKQ